MGKVNLPNNREKNQLQPEILLCSCSGVVDSLINFLGSPICSILHFLISLCLCLIHFLVSSSFHLIGLLLGCFLNCLLHGLSISLYSSSRGIGCLGSFGRQSHYLINQFGNRCGINVQVL